MLVFGKKRDEDRDAHFEPLENASGKPLKCRCGRNHWSALREHYAFRFFAGLSMMPEAGEAAVDEELSIKAAGQTGCCALPTQMACEIPMAAIDEKLRFDHVLRLSLCRLTPEYQKT